MLSLSNKVDSYTMNVIKKSELAKGSIHPKHHITDFHDFFTENISSEDSVLDVGCAYGHLANEIAKKAKKVTAIELRQDAIDMAKKSFLRENLHFYYKDFFEIMDKDTYDVITMSNVLEHIKDREIFLSKAFDLTNKILIRVPAFERHWLVPYKKSLGVKWKLNHDHKIEHTMEELVAEVTNAGFEVESIYSKWGNYCLIGRS